MHGQLSGMPKSSSSHIRFTSNVLRSLGIVNDIVCLALAYLLA